jgi:1-acyl-sn-glycerol-3-phosphate acyltransferase
MAELLDRYAHTRQNARQAWLARVVGNLVGDRAYFALARLLYRLRIEGQENIPTEGACIFAMNHEALLTDALVYLTVRRRRPNVHVFAWGNLRGESPLLDFLDRFGEHNLEERFLRVYKARGLSAVTLLHARQALLGGEAVIITAEGYLTWDGRFQYPLEPGAAWMALRTGAPVVPIISVGGYDVQPYWRIERMKLTGKITIRAGQPLFLSEKPIEGFDAEALDAANQRLWEVMHALIQEIRAERYGFIDR